MNQKHIHFSWNPIHPHRDWRRLLFAFVVLVLLVIGFSVHLFFSLGKSSDEVIVPADTKGVSTSAKVQSIADFFDKRR